MNNPFSRKRRDPIEQALDALEEIRSEAAKRAAGLRDAAADAVELLGEAAPEARRYRVPVAGAIVAAGLGTAIALRARRRNRAPEPLTAEAPVPSAAATAAKTTASAPSAAEQVEPKPAAAVEPEKPKEPQAKTDESQAADGAG